MIEDTLQYICLGGTVALKGRLDYMTDEEINDELKENNIRGTEISKLIHQSKRQEVIVQPEKKTKIYTADKDRDFSQNLQEVSNVRN